MLAPLSSDLKNGLDINGTGNKAPQSSPQPFFLPKSTSLFAHALRDHVAYMEIQCI